MSIIHKTWTTSWKQCPLSDKVAICFETILDKQLRVDPAKLLSFVLNYGKINAKQDGVLLQVPSQPLVGLVKPTISTQTALVHQSQHMGLKFLTRSKTKVSEHHPSNMQMLADILDAMLDCQGLECQQSLLQNP